MNNRFPYIFQTYKDIVRSTALLSETPLGSAVIGNLRWYSGEAGTLTFRRIPSFRLLLQIFLAQRVTFGRPKAQLPRKITLRGAAAPVHGIQGVGHESLKDCAGAE